MTTTPCAERLSDGHGRIVSYFRISVTDRCNLRCRYCVRDNMQFIPHDNILRYEEIDTLVDLAVPLGVTKIRLTGGEPLVRKDFIPFLGRLSKRHPQLDLRVTTNGTMLTGKAGFVREAGVKCLNISLDTLDPGRFKEITGRDFFERVMDGIGDCLDFGIRVKINAVAMKGVNDDELGAFIDFARANPVDVRFIEFMPIGCSTRWTDPEVWTMDELLKQARTHAELTEAPRHELGGPARVFNIEGGKGRLGLISPISAHFCTTCNRLRLTSQGNLRTCLYSDKEYRLRNMLRHPKLGQDAIMRVLRAASSNKPLGYKLLRETRERGSVCTTRMSAIGG